MVVVVVVVVVVALSLEEVVEEHSLQVCVFASIFYWILRRIQNAETEWGRFYNNMEFFVKY